MLFAPTVSKPTIGHRLLLTTLTALLVLSIAVIRTPAAEAQVSWCWYDPALIINGRVVHIDLGVPQGQVETVTNSTLTVRVPDGVAATLAGAAATDTIMRLRVDVNLVVDSSLKYRGSGPVPVEVDAVINAPVSTATALKASQYPGKVLAQTYATGGKTMTIAFNVE